MPKAPRRVCRAALLASLLALLFHAGRAGAQGAPKIPEPTPLPLRLDSQLPLLTLFRDPAGHPDSGLSNYRHGPFASWTHRSWQTLDWELLFAGDGPINPRFETTAPPADACFQRATEPTRGWPFVHEREHWFAEARPDEALIVADELVPPWLRRLDVHFAHALTALHGCGRGGDCSPGSSFPAAAFARVWNALSPKRLAPPWWECKERPTLIGRHGSEQDRFVVLRCDGSVPDDALERLSMLARPPGFPRPEALPPAPDPRAPYGEWTRGIRLLHPRLLWVLHRISLQWPWRGIYIFSGYRRPDGSTPPPPGSHKSRHWEGQALDITVHGVENEELLKLCRELPDVGCGYYPKNKFVHVDVRRRGTGKALWIDASEPGEPARYVDSWPGVIEGGALVWAQHR